MEKRVVVTAMNMITALGLDLDTNWEKLVAGQSGIGKITLFDASEYSTQIAGELPGEFLKYSKQYCKKFMAKQMGRATWFAFVSAKAMVEKCGIDFDKFDKRRCAVIMGAVDTGHSRIYEGIGEKYWIVQTMGNAMPAWISLEYKLEGRNFTIATACASAAYAMAHGWELIVNNQADCVIVGGASAIINPEHVGGFGDLYALSVRNDEPEKASRPFSVDRDGFVIGEGAGVLILESEESAKARGAEIHSELAGYALTSEGYNIMSPMKDGSGMAKTMDKALKHAKVNPEDVDYINAHGTSTPANDMSETLAIKKVFGDHAYRLAVSSSKSMIGHTVSAGGGVEGIITILSIKNGLMTPTINYNPDPELDLDYVPNEARKKDVNVALSNSFGFGGHNATLVFKKYC
ncbi:beta-ketoacyl-[acyl-carrier-protein] synthase family protein [Acidobacteriota bacterium]